jgi:hypothetical protein
MDPRSDEEGSDAHDDSGADSGGEASEAANQNPISTRRRDHIDPQKDTPISILMEIAERGVDFKKPHSYETTSFISISNPWFERRARDEKEQSTKNILHILAEGHVPSDGDIVPPPGIKEKALWKAHWNDEKIKHFLVWLSEKYPAQSGKGFFLQYIQQGRKMKQYPLGIALENGHDAFVQAILSLGTPTLKPILNKQHQGQRYVQLATVSNSSLLEGIIQKCQTCNVDVLDKNEPTPLHVVMEKVYDPSHLHSTDSANSGKSVSITTAEIYNRWKDKLIESAANDAKKSKSESGRSAASTQGSSGALGGDRAELSSGGTSRTPGTQISNGVPAGGAEQRSYQRFEPTFTRRSTGRMEQETKDAGESSVPLDTITPNESHGGTQGQSVNPLRGNTRDSKTANDRISVKWEDVSELLVNLAKDYQKPLGDGSLSQIAKFELFVNHYKESLVSDPFALFTPL